MDFAIQKEFPEGVRGKELKLVSDNGSQPTSTSFMRHMALLGIKQIFTSYDNPKGNAETERVIRTIKEELIWLNEFGSLEEARESIRKGKNAA
jgi:transposase InsO family protein